VWFGSLLGRTAYQVEADRHHTNGYCVLVGASSEARKGTSLGQVLHVMKWVDPVWAATRRASGLASGEGIVWRLRDGSAAADETAGLKADPGELDKRPLVYTRIERELKR
jgi:hypothetical protein